jgi:hypothetical protein
MRRITEEQLCEEPLTTEQVVERSDIEDIVAHCHGLVNSWPYPVTGSGVPHWLANGQWVGIRIWFHLTRWVGWKGQGNVVHRDGEATAWHTQKRDFSVLPICNQR